LTPIHTQGCHVVLPPLGRADHAAAMLRRRKRATLPPGTAQRLVACEPRRDSSAEGRAKSSEPRVGQGSRSDGDGVGVGLTSDDCLL